ncbi:unnamed protein product [Darwinula stevensoni]|uniref:Peptidase S1 domain-containing protein n=1 Tax=Darwinula stevensoni TaxID=69355 RepID=A0A7R8X7M7_9CRUS|nr:unnamed protein product [Darwinula stevensoni]CAG0882492.1 unnamed protein product [Darwinula stevensoni]
MGTRVSNTFSIVRTCASTSFPFSSTCHTIAALHRWMQMNVLKGSINDPEIGARDSLPCSCGVSEDEETSYDSQEILEESDLNRIIGGTPVPSQRKYPWMAWMTDGAGFCGGALINDRYVLTASHCVFQNSSGKYNVTLGNLDVFNTSNPEAIKISATAIMHPEFKNVTSGNDVALLKLDTPLNFTDHPHICPICISTDVNPNPGTKVTIAGWGRISGGGPMSGKLREATVYVISQEACQDNFHMVNISENVICTQSGGKNVCNGDSGSSLMYQTPAGYYISAGITSFGREGCSPEYGAVFTRTANYLRDFVKSNTEDAVWCRPPSGAQSLRSSKYFHFHLFWFLASLLVLSSWK